MHPSPIQTFKRQLRFKRLGYHRALHRHHPAMERHPSRTRFFDHTKGRQNRKQSGGNFHPKLMFMLHMHTAVGLQYSSQLHPRDTPRSRHEKQKMAMRNLEIRNNKYMYQFLDKNLWTLERDKRHSACKPSEPQNETLTSSASFMNGDSAGEGEGHTSCIQKHSPLSPLACIHARPPSRCGGRCCGSPKPP